LSFVLEVSNSENVFSDIYVVESMAYLVEKSMFPKEKCAPVSFTYNSVRALTDCVYPEWNPSDATLACLCDISLLINNNSGYQLYKCLLYFRNANLKPTAFNDILNNSLCATGIDKTTMFDNLKKYHSLAFKQLYEMLTTDQFEDLKAWFEHLEKESLLLRMNQIQFIEDLIENKKYEYPNAIISEQFAEILEKLGSGALVNLSDNIFLIMPKSLYEINPQTDRLLAINSIYRLAKGGYEFSKCKLFSFCSNSENFVNKKGITCDKCKTEPWNRKTEELCAYNVIWKTWDLPVN
jgi:hypothetical protein